MSEPAEKTDLEEKKAQLPIHHDLDFLAGTWSEEDAAEFDNSTEAFRRVDEELWQEDSHL